MLYICAQTRFGSQKQQVKRDEKTVPYRLPREYTGPLKTLRISAIHQRDDLRVLGMATSRKADLQRQLRELMGYLKIFDAVIYVGFFFSVITT